MKQMTTLERAALFESVNEVLEEIQILFEEHGFDTKDFDEDELDESDDIGYAYLNFVRFKTTVEL